MKKDLFNTIITQVKQGITDINAGEGYNYLKFKNNEMTCYSLCNSGGYSIIFDTTNDRLIVAWLLKISVNTIDGTLNGSWGQGYYFLNNGGNDVIERYDIANVSDLWIDKALGLNVCVNP